MENGCKLFCFSNTYFQKQVEPACVFQNTRKCFGFKKAILRVQSPLAEMRFCQQAIRAKTLGWRGGNLVPRGRDPFVQRRG